MKISDILNEMPILAGDLRPTADDFVINNKNFLDSSTHIGDIEKFLIKKNRFYYSLWDNNDIIFVAKVVPISDYAEIDDVWVKKDYAGQKIFSKFLWFLKSREQHNKIMFGPVHSKETYELLKSGGLSKFTKSWFNIKTNEIKKFEPENDREFYRNSAWRIMLENIDEYNFSKFNGTSWIQESYEWQIK